MKNIKNTLLIIFLGLTIYLCYRIYQLENRLVSSTLNSGHLVDDIPDTVYRKKPFKLTSKFQEVKNPSSVEVSKYFPLQNQNSSKLLDGEKVKTGVLTSDGNLHMPKTKRVKPSDEFISDTLNPTRNPGNTDTSISSYTFSFYSPGYLNHQQKNVEVDPGNQNWISEDLTDNSSDGKSFSSREEEILLQILLSKTKFDLTTVKLNDSLAYTKKFNLDLENYKYNYQKGVLTQKRISAFKKIKVKPYLYSKYRPINQLFDIGGGLLFKTGKFNYTLGINGYYYPNLQSSFGKDLEVTMIYTF